jgi:hypothetical protein
MTEDRFDQLLQEMREEKAPPEQAAAACERVWRQIGAASAACAEFRPDFPRYLAGELTESRRLLMDDHLGRCADCRRALAGVQSEPRVIAMPGASRRFHWPGWTRWAVAAGVALTALYLGRGRIDSALAPSGPRATVVSVSGALYRLPQSPILPGAAVSQADVVRTSAGSRAVLRLADGSRVEMNQRTELSIEAAWSGETIRLDRGDVIVQAARQRRGHLRVVTRDSVASVKGTVFAVSSGAAGSVVSVVEGSVAVSQAGGERMLTAGKQSATNRSLEQVKVRDAVSWSQDAEKYSVLLAELMGIEKQIAETASPALRTDPGLLQYLPANAIVYVAIPNLNGALRQALGLIDQRARENTVLNEWWSSEQGQELKQTFDRFQAITPLLGEEMAFVLTDKSVPLFLARIRPSRQETLQQAITRVAGDRAEKIPYRIAQDLLLVSDSDSHLAAVSARLGAGTPAPFAAEIARRYQRGVGWLAAVDGSWLNSGAGHQDQSRMLGLLNMRYLFFEQRSGGGRDENEATLSFRGSRTGLASWLAAPGSAGSLEYVSSDSILAVSASTRDPRQAFDEIFSGMGQGNLGAVIGKLQSETGVDVGNDIASSLGTDFSLSIERPSLPIPGWVAALEVVRPGVLDDAIKRLVEAHNRSVPADHADWKITLSQETVNGRSFTSVRAGAAPVTLYWTYDRGYLIASMDRALAIRAITLRESGSSLPRSANFQQRFPSSGGLHHSGFLWFNPNGIVADLAGLIENPTLKNLMSSREPVLVVLDGETEQIRAASRNRLTSLVLDSMLLYGAGGGPGPSKDQPRRREKALRKLDMKL